MEAEAPTGQVQRSAGAAEGAHVGRIAPQTPPTSQVLAALPAAGWRVAAGAVWLLAVFLAYYTVHKPLASADLLALRVPPLDASWEPVRVAARLGGEVLDLLVAAWVMALAGAIGQALWRALRLPALLSAESRLIGTILGLGALGLAAFALGLLGLLRAPVAYLLLAVPTVALARGCIAQASWWLRAARTWWHRGWSGGGIVERMALAFVVISAALVLLATLLPPTAWDALAYHLPAVRADATAGRIVLDPYSPQIYQPQLMEMLYTLLYLVRGGDSAAQPLHAACGALAVALVACMAWRAAGTRAAVRATALALAIPLVTTIAGWAYVDLPLVAAELAALAALALWHTARRAGATREALAWLLVGGAAAGLGLDVKYTGAYGLAAMAVLVLGVAWRLSTPGTGVQTALLFAGMAAVVGCVWPLRNLLLIGDPIFPYHIGTLFAQGPHWDAGRTAYMEAGGWGLSALWRAPLLPLETTLLGTQQSVEFDGTIGPLLLLLLTLAPLSLAAWPAWRRSARAVAPDARPRLDDVGTQTRGAWPNGLFWRWPLAYAAVLGVIWGIELARSGVAMQSRLWLSFFLAPVVPASVAWLRLERVRVPSVSLGRLLGVGAAICLALTLATQTVQTLTLDNLTELAGAQDQQTYLTQQLGPYALAMRQVDTLPPSAQVLFLWEPRTYLTRAHVEPDAFIDNANALYRQCGDAAGITRCLRAQGFTHVLLYREGMWFVRAQPSAKDPPGQWAALDAARASWTVIYHDNTPLAVSGATDTATSAGWYVLYQLPPSP